MKRTSRIRGRKKVRVRTTGKRWENRDREHRSKEFTADKKDTRAKARVATSKSTERSERKSQSIPVVNKNKKSS